jgi:methylthioxylose transferase
VCFAAAVASGPWLLALPAPAFALASFVSTLVLRLALAAGSGGTAQWSAVFDPRAFEGPNEYLPAVGAWAAILVLRREGLRHALALSAVCAVALLAFHALLHAATGFDPIGALRSTEDVYRAGIASTRPYWFWVLGSPVAFLAVLGLPLSWLGLRALARGQTPAVAIFAVIAIAAVLGFTKAETERIWLFLAPFVCLAAAVERAPLRPLLAALAVQALLYEFAFDTVW